MIRFIRGQDIPEILDIERASFERHAWTEQDFMLTLKQSHIAGVVMEDDLGIDGYMVYEISNDTFKILNLAVFPPMRRQGVGDELVSYLMRRTFPGNRSKTIELNIRETNLGAQLFFKSLGFRAVEVLRDYWEDIGEDAYLMRYTVNKLERV